MWNNDYSPGIGVGPRGGEWVEGEERCLKQIKAWKGLD